MKDYEWFSVWMSVWWSLLKLWITLENASLCRIEKALLITKSMTFGGWRKILTESPAWRGTHRPSCSDSLWCPLWARSYSEGPKIRQIRTDKKSLCLKITVFKYREHSPSSASVLREHNVLPQGGDNLHSLERFKECQ